MRMLLVPSSRICSSEARRAPSPIDIIEITAATPKMTPSMVSIVRSLWRIRFLTPVRSISRISTAPLLGLLAPAGRGRRVLRSHARAGVVFDPAVPHRHDALAPLGDLGIVGDDHDRGAALVQTLENLHDLDPGARIQVA